MGGSPVLIELSEKPFARLLRAKRSQFAYPKAYLPNPTPMDRPNGVTTIAATLFLASGYLVVIALVKIISPEVVSLSLGAPLLHGLEISGPYMFLLVAGVAAIVGYGLLRLRNLARRAAIVIAITGVVMLIPKLSADAAELSLRLLESGFAVMIRVAIAWYLWQNSIAEKFR